MIRHILGLYAYFCESTGEIITNNNNSVRWLCTNLLVKMNIIHIYDRQVVRRYNGRKIPLKVTKKENPNVNINT